MFKILAAELRHRQTDGKAISIAERFVTFAKKLFIRH